MYSGPSEQWDECTVGRVYSGPSVLRFVLRCHVMTTVLTSTRHSIIIQLVTIITFTCKRRIFIRCINATHLTLKTFICTFTDGLRTNCRGKEHLYCRCTIQHVYYYNHYMNASILDPSVDYTKVVRQYSVQTLANVWISRIQLWHT